MTYFKQATINRSIVADPPNSSTGLQMKYFAKLIFHVHRYLAQKASKLPESNMTVGELFKGFCDAFNITADYGVYPHLLSSNGSSLWTRLIVQYLKEVTGGELLTPLLRTRLSRKLNSSTSNDRLCHPNFPAESMETIYGDMSRLFASADDVVSCEVPRSLEVHHRLRS